jgi:pyruvate dehydrogenase E2 component (dihydrolipoamide acetyltransferase)
LLVHGLGASSRVFEPVFAGAGPGRRVIAVDLPRTGRSGHWAASEPAAIAEVLWRCLTERGVERAHLFGHSFGGLVCLAMATAAPGRVSRLTLASAPALGLPWEVTLSLRHPLADLSLHWLGRWPTSTAGLRAYLRWIWGQPERLGPAEVAVYEDASQADGFGDGVLEALRSIASFRFDVQTLREARYPRRVLWGAVDPLVPLSQGARIAEALGADLVVLPDVGHCLPDESPAALQAALLAA